MTKVSETPYGMSETYTVKFWYKNQDGFLRQIEEDLYADSKDAHQDIEDFAKKNLAKFYQGFRIISVTYQ